MTITIPIIAIVAYLFLGAGYWITAWPQAVKVGCETAVSQLGSHPGGCAHCVRPIIVRRLLTMMWILLPLWPLMLAYDLSRTSGT
jgi:hypothetical protein